MSRRVVLFALAFLFVGCGGHAAYAPLPLSQHPDAVNSDTAIPGQQHLFVLSLGSDLHAYDLLGAQQPAPHLAWMSEISSAAIRGGKIYLQNSSSSSITSFNADGTQTGPTILDVPQAHGKTSLAVDRAGQIYYGDSGTGSIIAYAANGRRTAFNITGLQNPQGIAVDASGVVYVAENAANQVSTYDAAGNRRSVTVTSGISSPVSVAVDQTGKIYVANVTGPNSGTITTYAADGSVAPLVITTNGTPLSVAVGGGGMIYALSLDARGSRTRLTVYGPAGHQLASVRTSYDDASALPDPNGNVLIFGYFQAIEYTRQGVPTGFILQGPTAREFAVSTAGNIVAGLYTLHETFIRTYSSDGSTVLSNFRVWQPVTAIGLDWNNNAYLFDGYHGNVGVYNQNGRFVRYMQMPNSKNTYHMTVSRLRVYLFGRNDVHVYSILGVPLFTFQISSGAEAYLTTVQDLAVGVDGSIYVLATTFEDTHLILKYSAAGSPESPSITVSKDARALAVDAGGNAYVSIAPFDVPVSVQVYSPSGSAIRTLAGMPFTDSGGMRIH